MARACQIVDFQRYRTASLLQRAGEQQSEMARSLRQVSRDRAELAGSLGHAQQQLSVIADSYDALLGRLANEKGFRDACLAAADLGDLDEMVRRRDELAIQLERMREESTQSLFSDSK